MHDLVRRLVLTIFLLIVSATATIGGDAGAEANYFRDAANDLYRSARRDFDAGRLERAGELARAAEAMTHVSEHLGHAADVRRAPPPKADRKARGGKADSKEDRGEILPPPPCP